MILCMMSMCGCTHVCVCECMHLYAHVLVCICSVYVLYVRMCMRVCARAPVCMPVPKCVVCIICVYVYVCVCTRMRLCVYVCVCMSPPMSPLITNAMICIQTVGLIKQIVLLFEGNEISCSCVVLNSGVYRIYVLKHMQTLCM